MWESLAPDIYHCHLVHSREEIEIEDATNKNAAKEDEDIEPQKIRVFVTCEYESLYFGDGDVRKVNIEDKVEVELAHEEQGREGPPDVKL